MLSFPHILAIVLALGALACKKPGHPAGATVPIPGQLNLSETNMPLNAPQAGGASGSPATQANGSPIPTAQAGELALTNPNSPSGPVDALTLQLTSLTAEDHTENQPLATTGTDTSIGEQIRELLIRIALVPNAEYYRYYICSVSDPANCNPSPSAPLGFTQDTHIVQNLPLGPLRIVVTACVKAKNALNPNSNCGPELVTVFNQPTSPKP